MDLKKAEQMANDLLRWHGLSGWRFAFDRAVWRLGHCSYRKKLITLSRQLAEINNEENVLDTILHEIAHALCPKGVGHSKAWRTMATSIGCDGLRTANPLIHKSIAPKFQMFCTRCGDFQTFRNRRPFKTTPHSKCGGFIGWKINAQ